MNNTHRRSRATQPFIAGANSFNNKDNKQKSISNSNPGYTRTTSENSKNYKRSPADSMYSYVLCKSPTWRRDAWAVSITAMQVSRARFSTIAQTFVEDASSLLREAVAAAEFTVDFWPDVGGLGTRDLEEDAFFAFFAGGSLVLSIARYEYCTRFIVRHEDTPLAKLTDCLPTELSTTGPRAPHTLCTTHSTEDHFSNFQVFKFSSFLETDVLVEICRGLLSQRRKRTKKISVVQPTACRTNHPPRTLAVPLLSPRKAPEVPVRA